MFFPSTFSLLKEKYKQLLPRSSNSFIKGQNQRLSLLQKTKEKPKSRFYLLGKYLTDDDNRQCCQQSEHNLEDVANLQFLHVCHLLYMHQVKTEVNPVQTKRLINMNLKIKIKKP